jgi:hypothetical protein
MGEEEKRGEERYGEVVKWRVGWRDEGGGGGGGKKEEKGEGGL